jgi:hypothetical protein
MPHAGRAARAAALTPNGKDRRETHASKFHTPHGEIMLTRFRFAPLVALALTPFATIPVHAQKPALTVNVDEKGRVPYYDAAQGTCQNGLCTLTFKAVPAGYRLVITYASGAYTASTSTSIPHNNFASVFAGSGGQGNNSAVAYTAYLPATNVGDNVYMFSSPMTFYAEPNSNPQMTISNAVPNSQNGVISGYLVAIN